MTTPRPRNIVLPDLPKEKDYTAIYTVWGRVGVLDEPEPQQERAILATSQLVHLLQTIEEEISETGECRIIMFSEMHGQIVAVLDWVETVP